MQMPRYVETHKDWDEMCAFLESQDKSRLIDFIMSNIGQPEFFKRVHAYFGTIEGETFTADGPFEAYQNELMSEYEEDEPNTDYIISFSHRFVDIAAEMPADEKAKFLEKMADFLRMGVEKYSVGYANEDDWLIADCIKELCGEEF